MTELRYLDHAATTPVREEALAALLEVQREVFGNPSSHHSAGERAAAVLASARGRVARVLGCRPGEVIFTSGGTEADNLAIKGIVLGAPGARHVITSPIEHDAVLASVDYLVRLHGVEATFVSVDAAGRVDPAEVATAVRDDTALVSIAYANNEVGTVQPIAEIAAALRALDRPRSLPGRAWLHTDAVQAAGWLSLDIETLGADAMALAGHKFGAPRGIGAAIIRSRIPLEPLFHGGGQERGRRSGTEFVAGAVAFATALELAEADREAAHAAAARSRDAFVAEVLHRIPGARLTGAEPGPGRMPHLASFVLPGTAGEGVLLEFERRGLLASAGSACAAGDDEPSHVLTAMGVPREEAQTSVRFSLSHRVGQGFDGVAEQLERAVAAVRGLAT